jgi:hypothetical protein
MPTANDPSRRPFLFAGVVSYQGRHVLLPIGYTVVTDGPCQSGDRFFNRADGFWSPVEPDDIGLDATNFDILVRKGMTS